jgi:hypothetical protein
MASPTASPTPALATITAAVSATFITTITTTTIVLAGTVITAAGRIVLSGIVARRKVLRRGRIGIRLAFLTGVSVQVFGGGGRHCVVLFLEMLAFRGVRFLM